MNPIRAYLCGLDARGVVRFTHEGEPDAALADTLAIALEAASQAFHAPRPLVTSLVAGFAVAFLDNVMVR